MCTRRKKPTNIRLKRTKTPPIDVMGSDEPTLRAQLSRSTLSIASTGTLGNPGTPHGPTAHGTCVRRGLELVWAWAWAWAWASASASASAWGLSLGLGLGTG